MMFLLMFAVNVHHGDVRGDRNGPGDGPGDGLLHLLSHSAKVV